MTPPPTRSVYLGTDFYRARVAQLQRAAGEAGLDGLLVLNPANLMWATGFFHIPNERPLGLYLPADGAPILLVPFLEKENAQESWIEEIRWYLEYPGEIPAEVWMVGQLAGGRIGVDAASYSTFQAMAAAKTGLRLDSTVSRLRFVKTAAEIELTRVAASYADAGLEIARQAVADGLRRGITELDVVQLVQAETTARMKRELADLVNFYRGAVALTAHAGPRGALPHGQPGPVAIQPGDTLIVGIGVKVGGYHAESGCTFVVGEPTAEQRRCLEATWACDAAALAALQPGVPCSAVNEAAWASLRDAGYGEFIRHRIGHGMGVEGHEAPWLSPGDDTPARPGMVFSNEPGIYRPGIDGYRIIDSMVVTAQGAERLSSYLATHGPDDRIISI
ncbi:MAG: M24 family metallopeptidase [Caldilinea sp.]|jgi:Xaa-Pro dipeptidase